MVYAKAPFAGPEAVLAYLSRYTHRVAISNSRLIAFDKSGVTFRYKDYRRDGADRQQVMTLATDEFLRRFLLHVLPRGFHRIRHYGLLAGSARKASPALARELLNVAAPPDPGNPDEPDDFRPPCPCCGGRMIIIETFERWRQPRGPPDKAATNRSAAGTQPSATDPRVSFVLIDADRAAASRVPGRQYSVAEGQRGPSAFNPPLAGGGRAITAIRRKSKSP